MKLIPDNSILVTTFVLNTKINEVENKVPDDAKYVTTQEFNNLTADNFKERLKQVNLVSKTDFANKLISFDRKITSNKTKYLEVKKRTDDGWRISKQSALDVLELKKDMLLYVLSWYAFSWKSKGVYSFKLKSLYAGFLYSINFFGYRMGTKFDNKTL